MPTNAPMPPAAPTSAISASCRVGSASVCAFTTNATNSVRKPVSTRTAPLPHSATSTACPSGVRSRRGPRIVAGTSPAVRSTHLGMRRHSTVPATPSAAVNHSAPGDPHNAATATAIPPDTAPAARPKVVSREFVVTSVIASGSTRGVTAALRTTNDLLNTSTPSAAG